MMTTTDIESLKQELLDKTTKDDKAHPWRICPLGQHFVRTHLEHIPPSKTHPQGEIITRHEHCAHNPSLKDMLSLDEIHVVSNKHFESLPGPPTAGILTDFDNADTYDQLIRGWVRYWNDIFGFEEPLNPNLIKALMATESSFNEKAMTKNKRNCARGLLQITEQTLHILNDHKGELSNYLMFIRAQDLFDPSVNICCGVRWLFRKKITASARLGRKANWEEAVIEYKSYWDEMDDDNIPTAIIRFRKFYQQLEGN